jgi:solute carrier family 25 protein 33/36
LESYQPGKLHNPLQWRGESLHIRAINFYFYPTSKAYLAKQFPNAPRTSSGLTAEDSPVIHLGAAVIAGIMTATGTNPIWGELLELRYGLGEELTLVVIKTRLQLSARQKHISPTFYSAATASTSPLPGPIAASAAALSRGSSSAPIPSSVKMAAPRSVNAISTAVDIVKTEGFRGLYRGMSASYLGVSEGVIQWVLYEVSSLIYIHEPKLIR